MLYYLLYPLRDSFLGFNLFKYISFRATSSAILALAISLFIGPLIIRKLQEKNFGEEIRQDGPKNCAY